METTFFMRNTSEKKYALSQKDLDSWGEGRRIVRQAPCPKRVLSGGRMQKKPLLPPSEWELIL